MKLTLVKRPTKESTVKCDNSLCNKRAWQALINAELRVQYYCDDHSIVEHWQWNKSKGKWELIIGPEGTPYSKD